MHVIKLINKVTGKETTTLIKTTNLTNNLRLPNLIKTINLRPNGRQIASLFSIVHPNPSPRSPQFPIKVMSLVSCKWTKSCPMTSPQFFLSLPLPLPSLASLKIVFSHLLISASGLLLAQSCFPHFVLYREPHPP